MNSPESRRSFLKRLVKVGASAVATAALAGCDNPLANLIPAAQVAQAAEKDRKGQSVYSCTTVQPKNHTQFPFTNVNVELIPVLFPDQTEALAISKTSEVIDGMNIFAQRIKEYQEKFLPVTYTTIIKDSPIVLPYSFSTYQNPAGSDSRFVSNDAIDIMNKAGQIPNYSQGVWRQYMFAYFTNSDKYLGNFNPWPGLGSGIDINLGLALTHLPWRFLTVSYRDQSQIIMDMYHEAWRGLGGQTNEDPNSILHVGAIPATAIPTAVDIQGICLNTFRTFLPSGPRNTKQL